MRTYSSFILFEEVLDFVPTTDPDLYQFTQDVIKPTVRVIQADCGTVVGTIVPTNYEAEGLIELATDATITETRVSTLLAAGTYSLAVRDLYSCVSEGGVCIRCYQGTYIDTTTPSVGDIIRLLPDYNYQTDLLVGNGTTTSWALTELSTDYTKVLVLINGAIQLSGYSITNDTIIFSVAPVLGTRIVVKFHKITAQPFVGLLANTYSGALLGMKPLPAQPLHIRPSLAQSLYSEEQLNIMFGKLTNYNLIPSDSLEYTNSIHDKLEKAIYISMLYGIFVN